MHNNILYLCGIIMFSDKSKFQNAKCGNGRQVRVNKVLFLLELLTSAGKIPMNLLW